LEEQKLLLNDPGYTRTVRTWVKKDGQLTPVDKQQRVLPWWRVTANGSYVFFIRLGSKAIEFEKGKNAIAVPALNKIPLVIDILITAVRSGEVDEQLVQTKKPGRDSNKVGGLRRSGYSTGSPAAYAAKPLGLPSCKPPVWRSLPSSVRGCE
jgi:hypothetical protein